MNYLVIRIPVWAMLYKDNGKDHTLGRLSTYLYRDQAIVVQSGLQRQEY